MPAWPGACAEKASGDSELALARDRGEPAGFGTDTLASRACLMLPLKAPMRVRGVLALEPGDPHTLGPEQRRLLDTWDHASKRPLRSRCRYVRAQLPSLKISGVTYSSNPVYRMAIVNGQVLVDEGRYTAARPGRIL
mgnify:CR=1 FL=1